MAYSSLGLQALLFSVFDKDEGPMVKCSDPPNAVGRYLKVLGRYLLPETFIKGRVVSVVLDDNVIIGAPVYIEDTLYDRNCFQFNICMVISSSLDPWPHRDIAQHLASAFHALEVEINLLSASSKVEDIQEMLAHLRYQLNTSEECFVRVGTSHAIAFKVRRWRPVLVESPALGSVPVPLVDLQAMVQPFAAESSESLDDLQPRLLSQQCAQPVSLDPTLSLVLPWVDGIRTVRQIMDSSPLDDKSVLVCLRHLIHFELVTLIDQIDLEGRYRLTPKFHTAFEQKEVRDNVVPYVTAGSRGSSGSAADEDSGSEVATGTLQSIQVLYAQINGWEQTLGQFKEEHVLELLDLDISLRHFITFGLLWGFLERIDSVEAPLTHGEIRELQTLRSNTIPAKKQELQDKGLNPTQVNKNPEIQDMVARMNALKEKELGLVYTSEGATSQERGVGAVEENSNEATK
eukprot:TRINITY_DN31210_c0_g1_i1.p1 TRINITY_DN31210_c0_g1~~TRINITY_DN31210_c0_g1_i1.p1  ORF type:complete len:460 (-),score=73.41 TRINITY_DN31210_c0_g1_i1:30-1409(-)